MPCGSDHLSNLDGLLDFQIDHAEGLLNDIRRNRRVIDGSDTGIGKTYTSCAVLRELGDLPTLVVAPKSSLINWERVGKYMGAEVTPVNYERLIRCETPYGWMGKDERGHERWFWHDAIRFIIFDEAHRCGGTTTFSSKMMIAARHQDLMGIALSATAAETPERMKALGYFLGLFDSPPPREELVMTRQGPRLKRIQSRAVAEPFRKWAQRHGCMDGWDGWGFYGDHTDMQKIHRAIYPGRGRRLKKSDVPGFPETLITPELVDFGDAKKMASLYDQMRPEMEMLQAKFAEWNPECEALDVLKERQEVDMLRVPVLVERAMDSVAEGNSHVIFVPYRATLEALFLRLHGPKYGCSVIWGGQTAKERQRNIDAFQFDEHRLCVIVNRAGGESISLHDINGKFPRSADIIPPWEAWLLIQMLGRIHRAGAKSKSVQRILCAAGTYEETVYGRLVEKATNLEALNDYDINPLKFAFAA